MTQYVTGTAIRTLREKKHYTQKQLADRLCVSDKTVSKWENGRGFPDIALLEPLDNHLESFQLRKEIGFVAGQGIGGTQAGH